MPTLREICTAFGPAYVERYPPLPLAHRTVLSAIQPCQSGHDGHRLSQCHTCGGTTVSTIPVATATARSVRSIKPPNGDHHLDKQLPGPHFLLTCTVPATLRPFLRSPQRLAYQAMLQASATALKRLATDERCIGTDLPG